MKRWPVLFSLIAGVALLLAACGGAGTGSPPPAGPATEDQTTGERAAGDSGVGTPGRVRLVEFYADW